MTILTPPPDTAPTPLSADERDNAITALREAATTMRLADTDREVLRNLSRRTDLANVEQDVIVRVAIGVTPLPVDLCQAMVLNGLADRLTNPHKPTTAEQMLTALAAFTADHWPEPGGNNLHAALRRLLGIARPSLPLDSVRDAAADLVAQAARELQAAEYGEALEQVQHA